MTIAVLAGLLFGTNVSAQQTHNAKHAKKHIQKGKTTKVQKKLTRASKKSGVRQATVRRKARKLKKLQPAVVQAVAHIQDKQSLQPKTKRVGHARRVSKKKMKQKLVQKPVQQQTISEVKVNGKIKKPLKQNKTAASIRGSKRNRRNHISSRRAGGRRATELQKELKQDLTADNMRWLLSGVAKTDLAHKKALRYGDAAVAGQNITANSSPDEEIEDIDTQNNADDLEGEGLGAQSSVSLGDSTLDGSTMPVMTRAGLKVLCQFIRGML